MSDHPMMAREIVVFMAALPPGDPKPRFCAQFSDGAGFLPVMFRGHSKAAVIDAAEAWRAEEVEKDRRRQEARAAMSERARRRAA